MNNKNTGDGELEEKIAEICGEYGYFMGLAYENRKGELKTHEQGVVFEMLAKFTAQEATKARLDELVWARDMAEKDITGHELISLNYINQRISIIQNKLEGLS